MYLVFVAYYDSMIFSKIICSEGGDFSRIIEMALFFHLQLSKPVWPDLEPMWPVGPKWDISGTFSGEN